MSIIASFHKSNALLVTNSKIQSRLSHVDITTVSVARKATRKNACSAVES